MNIAFVAIIYFLITISSLLIGIHEIPEGYVGVYYRNGKLLEGVTEPGYHVKIPFVTRHEEVQYTIQTDVVRSIPCGTSGGTIINFDTIEVVNQLQKDHVHNTVKRFGPDYDSLWIFARIHHEMNQFCSSHTLHEVFIEKFDQLDEALADALQETCDKWETGIRIVTVRVTKPKIPIAIRQNYENVEAQKSRLAVIAESEEVMKKNEETEKLKAVVNAKKIAEVAFVEALRNKTVTKLDADREIEAKKAELQRSKLEVDMFLEREKALVDAHFYAIEREALANEQKLTPEFLRSLLVSSIFANSTLTIGNKIPKTKVELAHK